ncbi:MAG: arsinothricin resistance N-acetyltransferase ArsN1 [Gemmatimonadaceae bacterium]|jgi:phosphinothricin acetyltransferase|nr:arsinothricin resistance N-acetyltransferase ArsN1 [Gemmatimonadaceae bacterium]
MLFGDDRFTLVADVRPRERDAVDVPLLPLPAATPAVPEDVAPDPDAIVVRPAARDDAPMIASIYNDGIRSRLATFETVPRSPGEVREWFEDPVAARFPFLVASDGGGQMLGWIRGGAYRTRACYAGVTDYSVYVAEAARGRGVGDTLMGAFVEACREAGVWKIVARIFPENAASRALCARHGFREVGVYERHAQLDGAWRDVIIVERLLVENQP